jgi:hypothetical protein
MNKAAIAGLILKNPFLVLKKGIRFAEDEYHRKQIERKFGVKQLKTVDFLDLFDTVDDTITNYSFLNGTSLLTDLLLLKKLAQRIPDCNYLEIGSWRGESISNVAQVAKTCTSLTLSAEEMVQLGMGKEFAAVHGIFSKGISTIQTIEANSFTFDFSSLNTKYDLIFIDGDHTFAGVLNDTKKVFEHVCNEKTIVVWHDYAYNPEDVRHTVLSAILEGVPKEKHGKIYHVSNTMCAVYLPFDTFDHLTETKFPTYPNKSFDIAIKAKRL